MDNQLQPNIGQTSVGQVPMDRLRLVFEGMFDGVWLVASDGRTTYSNRAMASLLGSTPGAMRGRPLTDFLDEELWVDVVAFLARQRTQAGERMELRFRRADGSDLFGVVAASPISTSDEVFVGTMLNVSDMTGKRAMDAQLVQSQRLEAIGQFAGGIAHDFNNLLTSILGYTELVRASLPPGGQARDDLDLVLASAERASAITRKLLAFTRRQVLTPVDVDPAQVITDLVPILGPIVGRDVKVELDIEAEHSWTRVDPTQFEQILVNLVVNARDAMPAGGTVTIAVRDLEALDADRPDPDLHGGPFVRISVSDTGTGMDGATAARIFDPFFTTKDPGKGTGLGLATVLDIVVQSGGEVHVMSVPGQGSTFSVDLLQAGVGPRKPSRSSAGAVATPRSGVVLLVEDDAGVERFAARTLDAAGYTVLEAQDSDQALRAAERWGERIDVLVTDIGMPGLHGPELATRIRLGRPDVGVVFISGHAAGDAGQRVVLGVAGEFLPKPFSMDALVRAVARAADGVDHGALPAPLDRATPAR